MTLLQLQGLIGHSLTPPQASMACPVLVILLPSVLLSLALTQPCWQKAPIVPCGEFSSF